MLDAIFNRRSVRRFTGQPVSDEQVNFLLRAAMAAPSAGNEQPWEFIVVRDRKPLEAITEFHPNALMLKEVDVGIVVCADPRHGKYPFDYWIQDCAAATENMLLAAVAIGLGTCWLGMYPQPERVEGMRRAFRVPEPVMPFAIVAVGYPAHPPKPVDRFNPARVHVEQW